MYRVGYIDDQPTQFGNIQKKFKRFWPESEFVLLDGCKTREEFLEKIYEEQIDVLLVDYKMAGTFGFNGSTLINYINDQMRDLECFVLTAVEKESVKDGLVPYRNVQSKNIFDTEGDVEERVNNLKDFLNVLKESAQVFQTRREHKKQQYLELLEKKKQGELSLPDQDEYLRLYKVLSSYGMIEKLPQEVLTSNFETDLENLLKIGESIIEKYKQQ